MQALVLAMTITAVGLMAVGFWGLAAAQTPQKIALAVGLSTVAVCALVVLALA